MLARFFATERPSIDEVQKRGVLKKALLFGISLEEVQRTGMCEEGVPKILRQCCEYMQTSGSTQLKGIFRISGDLAEIQLLKRCFDFGESVDLSTKGPHSISEIGRAVQQECRDRSRMPSSA
eukprot:TRINITY_DN6153_c0_g1_i3.p1 TRINITY_DN6153_c0_g1~~TRINITY_DN6153_c0_g1_i3.p1  ORF type:complete len:122 (-),score=10.49 TRINITY_DN6153_c0_g1_i3:10-375(-)